MIGRVDDDHRALIDSRVGGSTRVQDRVLTAWIDTAFDGHLVFSKTLIEDLKLDSLADTEAILADGRQVILETFVCYLDWFGEVKPLQVITNEGRLPLMGTGLLANHVLHIDYVNKGLTLA